MKTYTVKQVSEFAGISIRTLHHYDKTGLLIPYSRTTGGYRLYSEEDLLKLQQILFFRELEFPLREIGSIMANPSFDQIEALENHNKILEKRISRLKNLQKTINNTIDKLKENQMDRLTEDELYEGFSKEQIERYKAEVREKYDPALVKESEKRIGKMSKQQWQAVKAEGEEVAREIAQLMDLSPDSEKIQQLIARHHAWIENFYTASAEVYRGLGEMYVENGEFREYYEKFRPGLAEFMKSAMAFYAENTLKADQNG